VGRYRWVICALLFIATTINYIDRQVVSLLGPTLSAQFGWSDIDYGHIIFNFSLAYAIGLLVVGRVVDRLGDQARVLAGDRVLESCGDRARGRASL
jgi:ACS family hexuronate transporter-like MFS transporter